jgi:hypothetical protein
MKILCLSLILFQAKGLLAEELTVYVREGLILREATSPKGKKILVIPFGTKLGASGEHPDSEDFEIEGIKAPFVSVKYRNREGYVFLGYLSRFPASVKSFETTDEYFKLIFGSGKKKIFKPIEEKSETEHFKIIYPNDISLERIVYLGGAYDNIDFPNTYSLREIFLLIRIVSPSFNDVKFGQINANGLKINRPIRNCTEGCPTESLTIKEVGNRIRVNTGGQT